MFNKKIIQTPQGIELYTETFGKDSDPAILLIAGAMAPGRFWTDVFCTLLADSHHFVIRYDHRDMGLSSAVDYTYHPYTLNDLAQDAIAILDAYHISKAHIIGHSMGGGIAQLMALEYPERVLSITLISSSVLASANLTPQEETLLNQTWNVMMQNKPTRELAPSINGFMTSFRHLHAQVPMDEQIARDYITDMYTRTKPEHLDWFEKFSRGIDSLHNHVKALVQVPIRSDELKMLHIPTLIIHGEQDPLAFPRVIKEYAVDLIPGAQFHLIPGMGHMILNQKLFSKIADIIISFIETSRS